MAKTGPTHFGDMADDELEELREHNDGNADDIEHEELRGGNVSDKCRRTASATAGGRLGGALSLTWTWSFAGACFSANARRT